MLQAVQEMVNEEHLGRWVGVVGPVDVTIESWVSHVELSLPDIPEFLDIYQHHVNVFKK